MNWCAGLILPVDATALPSMVAMPFTSLTSKQGYHEQICKLSMLMHTIFVGFASALFTVTEQ